MSKREISIIVQKLNGAWDEWPYWWYVSAREPYEYKSGGTFLRKTAIKKAYRAARKINNVRTPEIILEKKL